MTVYTCPKCGIVLGGVNADQRMKAHRMQCTGGKR